jgi:23S rRNA (uracil1939-C5)-methyltransferase
MVNLVTSYSDSNRMEILAEVLQKISTGVTTVVNTINSSLSPVSSGGERAIYYGQGTIEDRIGNLTFAIGPDTFFQPNTVQAERLYKVVRDFAQLKGNETLYDLYSGIGTLSLFLANWVKKVVAIEEQQIAIQDATYNAVLNDVNNCAFHCGDVRSELNDDFIRQHGKPDVVVVDPPRVGMHKDVSQALLSLAPERIVYVSCNPATQVRDLGILCQEYNIDLVQPVDMFPQTYHIENVVGLRRKSGD